MAKNIGIIGGGVVGLAVKNFFQEAKVYDKFKNFDTLDSVKRQEVIFICVPTPFRDGFDASIVEEAFYSLRDLQGTIVVIKSTVVPGTTERMQKAYPRLKVLFNPEFLDNDTSKEDFLRPDKQILGYTSESKGVAKEILSILPRAKYEALMSATAAEVMKYMVNTYYATKVIFANQFYDMCQKLGVEYDAVREAFEHDRRVAPGNFDVWHGGFRGFDGKCLPKDLASFLGLSKKLGVKLQLLEEVEKINNELLKHKAQKE